MTTYEDFPDNARVWVYQTNRALTAEQVDNATERLEKFAQQWLSHGKKVKAWASVLHQHFLVLMVDESYEAPSGCSIDSSVALVKELEKTFEVDFFDRMTFTYLKEDGTVTTANRELFATLYAQQKIGENTLVFNNLVATKAAFETTWKVPLKESWHANMV
ncbi:MAG: hypothetical protein AB8E82_04150 [Aureispira sp.]